MRKAILKFLYLLFIVLCGLVVFLTIPLKTVSAGIYTCIYRPPLGCLVNDATATCDATETLFNQKCGSTLPAQCEGKVYACDKRDSSSTPAPTTGPIPTTPVTTPYPASSSVPAAGSALVIPRPAPAPIPCGTYIKGKEFHSLRPYQASPCTMEVTEPSTLCGNTMIINDAISVTRSEAASCTDQGGSSVACHYNLPRSFSYRVDPSQATLPIAGNTEQVTNRYSSDKTIDGATQVNDYLSWYLNGTAFRVEELHALVQDKVTGIYDYSPIVDFTGPIRKLLPLNTQNQARATQVTSAQATRHNQTVACMYNIKIFSLDLGGIPVPCPTVDPSGNLLSNLWNDFVKAHTLQVTELKLTDWKGNLPPVRKDGQSFQSYYMEYRRWRGGNCLFVGVPEKILGQDIPLIGGLGVLVCYNDPLNPNYWADKFPWIPFTSTEDKVGKLTVSSPEYVGGDVTVTNTPPATSSSINLYFPHMEENTQLSDMLFSSIVPYVLQTDTSLGDTVTAKPDAECKILEVRSNLGDKLFGKVSDWKSYSYTAGFDCTFTFTEHDEIIGYNILTKVPITIKVRDYQPTECKKNATFAAKVAVTTPMIDTTWAKLVAGNASVFRRFFPKLGADTLGVIKDLPASTNVTYEAQSNKANGVTTAAPNPGEIYFPHLGGISEYFLKGIQTLLRPKGYGEAIEFANQPNAGVCKSNTMPDLPAAGGACKLCGVDIAPTLKQVLEAAGQAFDVPASVIYGTLMHEGGSVMDMTEENVKKWSACGGTVPGCDKNSSDAQIPFGWFPVYFYEGYWDAVKTVDSTRTKNTSSPCNLLDAAFATAKALSMWSGGLSTSVKYPVSLDPTQNFSSFPDICYTWDLKNGEAPAGSCSAWDANFVATSQVGYGGYCPEPGKHPAGTAFPDNTSFIQSTVDTFSKYTCH